MKKQQKDEMKQSNFKITVGKIKIIMKTRFLSFSKHF